MIGRADIEGSKATPLMNAWLPQASYPCVGLESSSTGSSFPADSAKPALLAVVSLDSRQDSGNLVNPFMRHYLDDEAFGYLKRVIVTPAVYPRLVEFLHFDIQSTGQKSHCVSIRKDHRNAFSELAVRRPGKLPKSRSQSAPADTRRSARHASAQAARQQSTGSNWDPEPSPQSQSFSGYGSILPTSLPTLFHRPEAVHLGDLMRYEYDRRERTRSSGFSRAGMHRHHATRRCSSSR
ncbi:hypothetical protein Bca4012_102691 [Brassica carinata]